MPEQHPTHLEIERLDAGLVVGDRKVQLEAHLEGCAECRSYAARLAAAREALHRELPPPVFAALVAERAAAQPAGLRWPVVSWVAGGLVAATAAVLLVIGLWPDTPPDAGPSGFRLMGSTSVRVFLRRGEEVSTLAPAAPLRDGDALRFEVTTDHEIHLAMVALTAGEEPQVLVPEEGQEALRLEAGQALLPGSVVVTADPEPVRLLLIAREAPFDPVEAVDDVREASGGRPVDDWTGEGLEGLAWTLVVRPEAP